MKQNTIHSPALSSIAITDPLFSHYISIVAEKLIPYQWNVLNDCEPNAEKSYCITNFRVAAGEIQGQHKGMVFSDTDAYKWIETLAYCLERGEALSYEPKAEELIDLIRRAQRADGYVNTYFSVNCPERAWTNFAEGHELYSAGHLIEAAVAYYRASGKTRLLEIACKFADLICEKFAPGGELENACPGHQEIELALFKLSDCIGENKYADLARHFLTVRGNRRDFLEENVRRLGSDRIFPEFAAYDALYAQSHLEPAEQSTAEGHAVRAMYMYSAMADAARKYSDTRMAESCIRLWKNVTQKRMYITGGIGSSGFLERFTTDYDLPNDRMYCESCASVGLMMFGQRMSALTGDASYYDTVELALCNTVLAGISAEGDKYFYVNPLEVWPENCLPGTSMAHVKAVRQPWFACACCPANISRTLASLGQYIYSQDEKSLYINLLISSSITTMVRGQDVRMEMDSELLRNGNAEFRLEKKGEGSVMLRIRIPRYLKAYSFRLNGNLIHPAIENGYAVLALSQEGIQTISLSGSIKPQWVCANTLVRADTGKIAPVFGPFVYCLEETDNGKNLSSIFVSSKENLTQETSDSKLPGNLPVLRFTGQRLNSGLTADELYGSPTFHFTLGNFTAIPYCLWCNRQPGEMTVWLNALLPAPVETDAD